MVKSIEKEVTRVAKLACLKIQDSDIEKFTRDFENILSFIEKINEVDTNNVAPLYNVLDKTSQGFIDKEKKSIPIEAIEKNAPQYESGHIIVPAVIE